MTTNNQRRHPSYLHLSPLELIEMAERRGLTMAEREGLDEAWFAMFGEMLTEDGDGRANHGA